MNIHDFQLHSRRTSPAIMSAAVSQAIHKALMESGPCLSEPIMSLQIYCEEEYIGMCCSSKLLRFYIKDRVHYESEAMLSQMRFGSNGRKVVISLISSAGSQS